MRAKTGILLTAFLCSAALGQGTDAKPQFDVASIKPAALPTGGFIRIGPPSGGPGTADPTRYSASGVPLIALVMRAFNVQPYQLQTPAWLFTERFEINAKIPEGATKEQFQLMLQNLLEDRFKMVAHREKKESQVYELVVGKSGHKMKESVEEPPKEGVAAGPPPLPPGGPGQMQMGKDGFPVLPPGAGRGGGGPMFMMMPGRAKMTAIQLSMDQLVTSLSNQLGKPVTDGTGLKGKYDFTLYFSPEGLNGPMGRGGMLPPPPPPGAVAGPGREGVFVPEGDPGPNLFTAVQEQLGLKLEQKKGLIDLVVVDKMEKVPTEN